MKPFWQAGRVCRSSAVDLPARPHTPNGTHGRVCGLPGCPGQSRRVNTALGCTRIEPWSAMTRKSSSDARRRSAGTVPQRCEIPLGPRGRRALSHPDFRHLRQYERTIPDASISFQQPVAEFTPLIHKWYLLSFVYLPAFVRSFARLPFPLFKNQTAQTGLFPCGPGNNVPWPRYIVHQSATRQLGVRPRPDDGSFGMMRGRPGGQSTSFVSSASWSKESEVSQSSHATRHPKVATTPTMVPVSNLPDQCVQNLRLGTSQF